MQKPDEKDEEKIFPHVVVDAKTFSEKAREAGWREKTIELFLGPGRMPKKHTKVGCEMLLVKS